MKKLPFFPFYPGDWKKNNSIGVLSMAARGLFVELRIIMHESERRGFLQLNQKAINVKQLGQLTRCDGKELAGLLKEIMDAGLLQKGKGQILFDPEMVADQKYREKQARYGKQGGNPSLHREKPANEYLPKASERQQAEKKSAEATLKPGQVFYNGQPRWISELGKVCDELEKEIVAHRKKERDAKAAGDDSHNICYI